ncbi:aspartate--tRNA ligase [Coprothermobacter platensis]|uniref:aspartate--tRNA ligase n=1 Tax=Coprothermobacter platensis TaxID=108819 RepID=UPI00036E55C8|nr:aspartate--tRNA ligase [Coprothermobacter platensis]
MDRTYIGSLKNVSKDVNVRLDGWVQYVRDFGKVVFFVLKDRTGIVQCYVGAPHEELLELAKSLSPDDVVRVEGKIKPRPADMVNKNMENGDIELEAETLELLNHCIPLPYDVNGDPNEVTKLKYRYVDIRHSDTLDNLRVRSVASTTIRNYLTKNDFWEVETPYLTKYTPGGARNFVVPVRQQPGYFYALAESPQIFKQILMISSVDRYFQFARCFRDEDLRADRQPEFTQVDIEASFITEEDIYKLIEGMMVELFKETIGVEIKAPFPRMTYDEAMEKYGSDKPDLRFEMIINDYTENFRESNFNAFKQVVQEGGVVRGLYWSDPLDRSAMKVLEQAASGSGNRFVFVSKSLDGMLTNGPKAVFQNEDWLKEGTYVFSAGNEDKVLPFLGELRLALGEHLGLLHNNEYEFVWVTSRPMFEIADDGSLQAAHHPFTMPDVTDINEIKSNPLMVRARAYDIVLNGVEVGGGSIRIHNADLQRAVFRVLGLSDSEIEERFGFFLDALSCGAPPHGGIALGFDRLSMILCGAESLREVIAFPKTKSGTCPLTGAPAKLFTNQSKELIPIFKQIINDEREGG